MADDYGLSFALGNQGNWEYCVNCRVRSEIEYINWTNI